MSNEPMTCPWRYEVTKNLQDTFSESKSTVKEFMIHTERVEEYSLGSEYHGAEKPRRLTQCHEGPIIGP